MAMKYQVIAMIGDYPLGAQPHWNDVFDDLESAKVAATTIWAHYFNKMGVLPEGFQSSVVRCEGETVAFLINCNGKEFEGDEAHVESDRLCESETA